MSLKEKYRVGQHIWYRFFCSGYTNPCSGSEPNEFEIIKVTDKTLVVREISSRYNSEWTIRSDSIDNRVWHSLADFYHDQSEYYQSMEDNYRRQKEETKLKLKKLLDKNVEENN